MIVQLSDRVGFNVRRIRLDKGLSQADLCERLKWPQPMLSDLERGKHTPTLPTVAHVAKTLKVAVDELFRDDK